MHVLPTPEDCLAVIRAGTIMEFLREHLLEMHSVMGIVDHALKAAHTPADRLAVAKVLLAYRSTWGDGDGRVKIDPAVFAVTAEEIGVPEEELRDAWRRAPVLLSTDSWRRPRA